MMLFSVNMKNMKMSAKIYAIVGLSFVALFGVAVFQLSELKGSLEGQKRVELSHLGELAATIAFEEHAAAQRGEATDEQAKKLAASRIGALRYGNDDYFWINDLQPRMIMHPMKPELNGRDVSEIKDPSGMRLFVEFADVVKRQGAGFIGYEWPKPGLTKPQPKLSYVVGFKPWGWVIGTGVYIDDLEQQIWSNAKRTVLIGSVVILVLGALTVFFARQMSSALETTTSAMRELAAGNFDKVVPGLGRKDEIGEMANALVVFRDAGLEKTRLEGQTAEQRREVEEERRRNEQTQKEAAEEQTGVVESLGEGLRSLSAGDLTFRLPDQFPEAYRQIRDDFNSTIAQLQETIQAIATATREVASTAAEISTSTTDLSQRTEEQAAGLEQTTASMEQISSTVKKNADNAQQANTFAAGTQEVADRGGAVVAETVSAMARIEESSRKISDIISVIDEIARQTNLLALNAAVEAARAGEAGRGFAVVASEVRSLAQRSAQAAKDIKDLITNSSGQVQEGVELVNRAGGALTEIVESIKKVAQIVAGIASASADQATGIDQINIALTQMDEVTQQNSALVEENAAAAKSLEEQAHGMAERVSFFQVGTSAPAAAPPRVVALAPKRNAAPASKRAPAAAKRGPAGGTQGALALKQTPDWKEF
jgi:methyl-accepting chemotaxis protein